MTRSRSPARSSATRGRRKAARTALPTARAKTSVATTKPARPRVRPAAARDVAALSVADFLRRTTLEGNVLLDAEGTSVSLTNLARVYWPREGYTKGDLLRYYLRVAPHILPHLVGRPAILKRHPSGITAPPFFQHDVRNAPPFLATVPLESETGRPLDYAVYDSLASLLYLVNLGTIAQNPWLSRVGSLDSADFLALDLDPHGAPFENVLEVALALRDALAHYGLRGYAKTSGSSGIHVFVPLRVGYDFEAVMRCAERLAHATAERAPKVATLARPIAARRKNQVYVDWQQNARGKSVASVYSVRAKPGATVSAPVTWDEIEGGVRIADFTIRNVPDRIRRVGDLWAAMADDRQSLAPLE